MKVPYDLVQVFTGDDLQLTGLLKSGDKKKTAYVFIHGFTGDFYSNAFYHSIAEKLAGQGNAIVLCQTRGTGLNTEFLKRNGKEVYIGSYSERIEDAHLDISAFIESLMKEGYQEIALIGYSLGTIKVVRYLFEGHFKKIISKVVLLAPFDKNAFLERKSPGKWKEFVSKAEQMVADGRGTDVVPVPEYEDYPMTYECYVSWYNQTDLSRMWDFYDKKYDFPIMKKITVPVKVILGSKDEFVNYPEFDVSPKRVLEIMRKNVGRCETVLVEGADHCYVGFEDRVAEEVAKF